MKFCPAEFLAQNFATHLAAYWIVVDGKNLRGSKKADDCSDGEKRRERKIGPVSVYLYSRPHLLAVPFPSKGRQRASQSKKVRSSIGRAAGQGPAVFLQGQK